MNTIIEIRQLTKRYGDRTAVDNLNLTVEQGDIFGFVGPNGAGKTSTLRMIAGLLQPTSGEILVDGHRVSQARQQVNRIIGYMPDFFGVYPDLKVWEYLDFFSACYQIPENDRPGLIHGLLDLVELSHRKEDTVNHLSRGMKQRLSLARTLIHEPQILILDEPAAGLDPRARVEIRELLLELARMEKTIFFSTHILADVAEICTRVGIVEAGKMVATGGLEDLHLQTTSHRLVEITVLDHLQKAQKLLENTDSVQAFETHLEENKRGLSRLVVEVQGDDLAVSELLTSLVQAGIPIIRFSEDNRDMEQIFLKATKGLVT